MFDEQIMTTTTIGAEETVTFVTFVERIRISSVQSTNQPTLSSLVPPRVGWVQETLVPSYCIFCAKI